MTNTARVTAAASGGSTARVDRDGTESDYDPWRGTWGVSWAYSWRVLSTLSAIGASARVTGSITEAATKRVTGV